MVTHSVNMKVFTVLGCCRSELQASRRAAKQEKATVEPPRLGKLKFEAEPLQVCHTAAMPASLAVNYFTSKVLTEF